MTVQLAPGFVVHDCAQGALCGRALSPAEREAIKSEYAYRANYNVYDQDEASTDWAGLAKAGFR